MHKKNEPRTISGTANVSPRTFIKPVHSLHKQVTLSRAENTSARFSVFILRNTYVTARNGFTKQRLFSTGCIQEERTLGLTEYDFGKGPLKDGEIYYVLVLKKYTTL